ncbi:MAG TPA: mechanosensitive ion channel family protein [Gemmatimonadaceae bacterium]|jgi:small-conductance mechanosensitive channel|nr:mechanosensitive ion channel family protein [Gemmatimonadaceae bacterium]
MGISLSPCILMIPDQLIVRTVLGNTSTAWITAVITFAATLAVLLIIRKVLVARLGALAERTATQADDFIVDLLRSTHGLFLAGVALASATVPLTMPAAAHGYVRLLLNATVIIQIGLWGNRTIGFGLSHYAAESPDSRSTTAAMRMLGRIALWAIIALLLLDNFGIHVTTLIATLGVGGIAVALAAQSVLGDLFAAVSIFLDRPFEIGDFIIFGDYQGNVEQVGLRSTRVRALSGEQVILSNSDLLKSRIRNYKRMQERRVVFRFGIEYETPRTLVAQVPGIIRGAIEAQSPVRFDRAHFTSFGASSLDYEAVYYVLDPSYNRYMDIQQAINLALMEQFELLGIGFAYPVQVIRVAGQPPATSTTP